MKTQINLKCPHCKDERFVNVKIKSAVTKPNAASCMRCSRVFVYQINVNVTVSTAKVESEK
jgi:uncharacterized Zn finger protein